MKSLEHTIRLIHEGRGHDAVTEFAAAAHEEWRKGFDPEGTGKERVKQNSDGTSGNINVPFHKLHPDWQKENLEAGKAALVAVRKHPRNMEGAAEHVHNEWMKRNPKAEWNASQHVPYSELPEDEKEKDRVHVRKMASILGKNISEENLCLEHKIKKVLSRESRRDDIETVDGPMPKYGGYDKLNTESDLSYMGSGTTPPEPMPESGKKKKTDEAVGFIGTDDYKGNQFRTVTPHIKPPGKTEHGHGHSQAPERVAFQRTKAKEAKSLTVHGKVSEAVNVKELEKGLEFLIKTAPEVKLPAVLTPKGPLVKPKGKELSIPKKEKELTVPKQKTEVVPKTGETLAEPKTAEPKTSEKDVKLKPAEPKVGEKIDEPKVAEPKLVEPKLTEPKVAEPKVAEPKVAEPKIAEPKVSEPKPAEPKVGEPGGLPFIVPPFSIPSSPEKHAWEAKHAWLQKPGRGHHAMKHRMHESEERKSIQDMPRPNAGDRHGIQFVGRSDADPKSAREKTSRQAQYKIKVIDENRKLAGIVLSTVKDKKQQMKTKTEDGVGQTSKVMQYPNGTRILINPEMSRTTMDINGKLPNDYK